MRTLQVAISDMEYGMFDIPSEKLNFSNFVDIVSKQLMRQNLNKYMTLAEKYELSSMTMDEITNEVKAKRLAKIKAVTKNISVDVTNYRFNREEANNYDE